MDFKTIFLKNEGRDLYIKSIRPEGEEENVLNHYRVIGLRKEKFSVLPENKILPRIELDQNTSVLTYNIGKVIPLITIQAQYRDILYDMYITDCISAEEMQFTEVKNVMHNS